MALPRLPLPIPMPQVTLGNMFGKRASSSSRDEFLTWVMQAPELSPDERQSLIMWASGGGIDASSSAYQKAMPHLGTLPLPRFGPVSNTPAPPPGASGTNGQAGLPSSMGSGMGLAPRAMGEGLYSQYQYAKGGGSRDDHVTPDEVSGAGSTPTTPPVTPPVTTPAPTPTTPVAPPKVGSDNDVTGTFLADPSTPNSDRLAILLRRLNYDPSRMGPGGQYLMKLLAPNVEARNSLLGYENGGDGTINYTTVGDDLVQYAKSFFTPGQSGIANNRALAQSIMQNPNFLSHLTGITTDQGGSAAQQQYLTNLQQLLYGGANDLARGSILGQTKRLNEDYGLSSMGFDPATGMPMPQFKGLFTDYLQSNPTLAARARALYGGLTLGGR